MNAMKKERFEKSTRMLAGIQADVLRTLADDVVETNDWLTDTDVHELGVLVKAFSMTRKELDYFYGEDPEFDELKEE